jgi:hypothetical protein
MAESTYQFRLTVLAANARAQTIATWLNNNLGANSVLTNLGANRGFSATGDTPATHRGCTLAMTFEQALLTLNFISQQAGLATVTQEQWNAATKQQKQAFVDSRQEAIWDNFAVYFDFSSNQQSWRTRSEAIAFLQSKGVTLLPVGEA